MSTSVGMKARKKQSALSARLPEAAVIPALDRDFEISLLSLENACQRVLESQFVTRGDIERLEWQQRLKNIATPVSLALAEYRGPRRFHYHYRHRHDDESVLRPVLEPTPVDMLAMVANDALRQCRLMNGIHDPLVLKAQHLLETNLQTFLLRYKRYSAKVKK